MDLPLCEKNSTNLRVVDLKKKDLVGLEFVVKLRVRMDLKVVVDLKVILLIGLEVKTCLKLDFSVVDSADWLREYSGGSWCYCFSFVFFIC